MVSASKSHWKRHGNGKKLSTVVKPSCELLFLLRLADFNVVHHSWGQSPGKSADHSNKSFLGLSPYLDMRVKWEVSLGLPRWSQLFRALAWGTWCRNCAREAGCFLQTPHLNFPPVQEGCAAGHTVSRSRGCSPAGNGLRGQNGSCHWAGDSLHWAWQPCETQQPNTVGSVCCERGKMKLLDLEVNWGLWNNIIVWRTGILCYSVYFHCWYVSHPFFFPFLYWLAS